MRPTVIALLLAAGPAMAAPPIEPVECWCRDSTGGRVELGEQACLTVGRRSFMARCAMSLNVTIWRETGEPCVTG